MPSKKKERFVKAGKIQTIAGLLFGILVFQGPEATAGERPNIIMFVVDDLNDGVRPSVNKQAVTPHLDRRARWSVTFSNAHAPGVFCAPPRTAVWTGLYASTTGCCQNEVFRYGHPESVAMQTAFRQGGSVGICSVRNAQEQA